jgi:ATP-binding cassette, subfamily A (ABC1), member 3
MLSGLYPPDAGTATIAGFDISQDMHEARKLLGVCPQHDVLLPDLTVTEHLEFFAGIKGCPPEEMEGEIDRLIKSVGLSEKRDVQAKLLSGGQKRKLSVAIAFIGNSKIVILDEPTSGMDPYSRRFTWNVIRQHREGRVIILVTHFMDEADLLGDRIAIMGDGKLRCCGSSLFLKKKYGVGYNMTLEKTSPVDFDTPAVLSRVQRAVPDAKVLTDVGTELTVQLPFASSQNFESLFGDIDTAQEELHIASYGMSVTTMEEVFLKVAAGTQTINTQEAGVEGTGGDTGEGEGGDRGAGEGAVVVHEGAKEEQEQEQEGGVTLGSGEDSGRDVERASAQQPPKKQQGSLFLRHMFILLQKRYLYFSRDSKSWLYQYILPVLFVLIGAIIMSIREFSPDQASRVMSPDMFNTKISVHDYPLPFSSGVCFDGVEHCPTHLYPHTQAVAVMDNTPDASNLPTEFVNVTEFSTFRNESLLSGMSRFLLDHREAYQASRYGAVSFHEVFSDDLAVNNGSVSSVSYSVHANFSGVHASPVTNQLVAEAVLRSLDPGASLTMRLHPLPETKKQEDFFSQWSVTNLVIFTALAIAFVPAGMASFVVYEKETKSRHQQMVSGVSIQAYWLSTWLWDSLSYQVTAWLMLIIIVAFPDTEPLSSAEAFPVTVGLLMLYGPAVAGSVYLFSYFLKTSASSQIVVIFAMFVQGLILSIVALVLRFIPSTRDVYMGTIRYFLIIFPPFAVIEGLNNLAVLEQYSAIELGGSNSYSPTDMKIAGLNLIVLGVEAVVFIAIQIAADYVLMKPQLLSRLMPSRAPPALGGGRDEDVQEEDRLVASGAINKHNSTVLLQDMTKVYSGGKYAVKGVSLGIPMGQCFGLLGVNGAGKSSLLNILSGEFSPTSGEAFISGESLVTDLDKCRQRIGFCPQFDALYDLLSGREHLRFYAAVKGIADDVIDAVVEVKLREMGLVEYADRATGGYSGGNKRKLSVAMAMIGDPTIVFLDGKDEINIGYCY